MRSSHSFRKTSLRKWNKKLINNFLLNDRPKYWVTSSRPSNFGDPLDAKTKADNWFDENRYV